MNEWGKRISYKYKQLVATSLVWGTIKWLVEQAIAVALLLQASYLESYTNCQVALWP
jgi:type IV secretory pathway VirB6-like protein